MKRQEQMLRRVLMRMIKRKLSMAMGKWREVAAEMARQQYMMGGAVRRMIRRQLSMAVLTTCCRTNSKVCERRACLCNAWAVSCATCE